MKNALVSTLALAAFANAKTLAPAAAETPAPTPAPAAATTETKKRVEPALAGVGFNLEALGGLPQKANKRGSQSLYPFDKLAKGEAFGVQNKTAANLSSIISNANRKNMRDAKDENGNTVYNTKDLKGADGSVTKVPDTNNPKREAVKHFYALDVDADLREKIKGTPLEGSSVLVIRDV